RGDARREVEPAMDTTLDRVVPAHARAPDVRHSLGDHRCRLLRQRLPHLWAREDLPEDVLELGALQRALERRARQHLSENLLEALALEERRDFAFDVGLPEHCRGDALDDATLDERVRDALGHGARKQAVDRALQRRRRDRANGPEHHGGPGSWRIATAATMRSAPPTAVSPIRTARYLNCVLRPTGKRTLARMTVVRVEASLFFSAGSPSAYVVSAWASSAFD